MLELDDVLEKLPSELSTGMKRAVAIGRALAQNPEAILFDEPTTMVDPIMAAHAGDLILKLKRAYQKTAIVVTHDLRSVEALADRVALLREGNVLVEGPFDEIKKSDDEFVAAFVRPTFTRDHV